MPKHDRTLNGKIIALSVLGPVSSPQDSEQGWYYDQSPSGAKSVCFPTASWILRIHRLPNTPSVEDFNA